MPDPPRRTLERHGVGIVRGTDRFCAPTTKYAMVSGCGAGRPRIHHSFVGAVDLTLLVTDTDSAGAPVFWVSDLRLALSDRMVPGVTAADGRP